MREHFKENIQLYGLLLIWILSGALGGRLSYLVIPGSLLLLQMKGMYQELILGYFFFLLLSDSLEPSLEFAKGVKNIYISLIALFFFVDRKSFEPYNQLYKLFVPFFLFSGITMMFSLGEPYFFTSVQKTFSYFISFLVIPNYIVKLYRESGQEFLRNFVFMGVTILVIGFVLLLVNRDVAYEAGRFRGFTGNPNGLGIFCSLFLIIFSLVVNYFPELFAKKEKIFIYLLIIVSVILSGSRNGLISIFIFYTFVQFFSVSPLLGLVAFIIMLLIAEIITANIVNIVNALGLQSYFRVSTLEAGSGRYIAWEFAWIKIQENFFIGKGFAYNEYYMRQHYKMLQKLGHQGGIHNSFLTFWMDQGLVGLLLYLRSYVLMFIKASKKTRYSIPIMFAISFTAFFESWLVGSLSVYAFLAMVIFTLITEDEIIPETLNQSLPAKAELQPEYGH